MNPDSKATAGFLNQLFEFGEMIKISHTLFALPFAIGAAFLAVSLQDKRIITAPGLKKGQALSGEYLSSCDLNDLLKIRMESESLNELLETADQRLQVTLPD